MLLTSHNSHQRVVPRRANHRESHMVGQNEIHMVGQNEPVKWRDYLPKLRPLMASEVRQLMETDWVGKG